MSSSISDHELTEDLRKRWNLLNQALTEFPKFQNVHQPAASPEHLTALESKLQQKLPREIRAAIGEHNGREHLSYGLAYRLPTTDLLPVDQWQPYEKDNDDFVNDLLQCLKDPKNRSADEHLHEDFSEHLGKAASLWPSMPCELLIIGRGMDDYAEEYLLSLRSGRIYLATHNIPEWKCLGSFADWLDKGLKSAEERKEEMQEEHRDF